MSRMCGARWGRMIPAFCLLMAVFALSCKLFRPNTDPVILEFGGPTQIAAGDCAEYWCGAIDHDSDAMTFQWSCTRGSFSDSGDIVHWTAPAASGTDTMGVTVTDGRGGSAYRGKTVHVVPCTTMIAHWECTFYALRYIPWPFTADSGWRVQGSFTVDSGAIDFLLLDAPNYSKWTQGQPCQKEFEVDSSSGSDVDCVLVHGGTHHLVFDNRRNPVDKRAHVRIWKRSP